MTTQVRTYRDRVTHIANMHITHYEVESISTNGQVQDRLSTVITDNATALVFRGSVGNLKRLAAVFGMSVEHSGESDGCHAITYDRGQLWHAGNGSHVLAVDRRIAEIQLVV